MFDTDDPVRLMLERIPASTWTVVSFNPQKQDACVRIDNGKQMVILNLFIPIVIVK